MLVEDIEAETKTAGGIILTDETIAKNEGSEMKGKVLECSPNAFDFMDGDTQFGKCLRKGLPGKTVMFAKYAGVIVEGIDREKYRVLNDKDIYGIRDD